MRLARSRTTRRASCWIGAAIFVLLSAVVAQAQITDSLPGYGLDDSPVFSYGLFQDYEQTRSPEQVARDAEIERQYRATMRKIPDKKPSNDPWKYIRRAPVVAADRYRPQ